MQAVRWLPFFAVLGILAVLVFGDRLGFGGFLLGVALVAVVGGAVLAVFLAERAIAKELRLLAERNGWTYEKRGGHGSFGRFDGFRPFGRGHSPSAKDHVSGEHQGLRFEAFTYRYVTGSGRSRRQHSHQVVAVAMPAAAPDLRIAREHVGLKVWGAVGGDDIDFESDAFSRRFWVQCEDRRFAYDAIPPASMEWLLEHAGRWAWQWRATTLVLVRPGTLRARTLTSALEAAHGFRERLPRHLVVAARA